MLWGLRTDLRMQVPSFVCPSKPGGMIHSLTYAPEENKRNVRSLRFSHRGGKKKPHTRRKSESCPHLTRLVTHYCSLFQSKLRFICNLLCCRAPTRFVSGHCVFSKFTELPQNCLQPLPSPEKYLLPLLTPSPVERGYRPMSARVLCRSSSCL
jgi:hypothetical protein